MSLLKWAKFKYEEAFDADRTFVRQAREAFKFEASEQWDKATKDDLGDKPALTFNLIKPIINMVVGMHDQNRSTEKAKPTDTSSDPILCEVLNNVKDKIYSMQDVEAYKDEVLESGIICGRGHIALDVELDPDNFPDIKINFEVIPYSEVKIDPSTRQSPSYICWRKWMSVEDFKRTYPKYAKEADRFVAFSTNKSNPFEEEADPSLLTEGDEKFSDTPDEEDYYNSYYYDTVYNRIAVVHMEYFVNYDRYYGVNPATGKIEEFKEENLEILKSFVNDFKYFKVKDKKIKWLQFTGSTVLLNEDNPLPFNDFSITSYFCYTDRSKKVLSHFGFVKSLIDPQKEVNKRWSQALNLLLSQSQGGYFIEEDVPADIRQWDDTIDDPGANTFVRKGAISQGKIRDKKLPEIPQAAMYLEEKAQQIINKISGINPELLEINTTQQQSGALFRFKQLQALTLLRKPFLNFELFEKQLARKVFAIIAKIMPEEQIQKILGEEGPYMIRDNMIIDKKRGVVVPLRDIKNLKYNIMLAPSATATGKTVYELSILMQMLQYNFPVDPNVLISKMDIPESDKAAWISYITQQQQAAQQSEQMRLQNEAEKDAAQIKLQQDKLQLKAQTDMAKLQRKDEKTALDYSIALAGLKQEDRKLVTDLITKLLALEQQEPKGEGGSIMSQIPPAIAGMIGGGRQ